jgi:hypothetical protein
VPASLYPQEDSWYSFLLEASQPQGHNAAGRIRSIEKSSNLIGNRTRDLPGCSTVPQLAMLPSASFLMISGYYDLYIFAVFKFMLIFHYINVMYVRERAREQCRKEKAALEVA